MAGDREKVLDVGMNDHIAKPINVLEMFSIMAKWITPSEPVDVAHKPVNRDSDSIELPPLPGIDVTAGLATCQGNYRLYKKLLLKFYDGYADFSEQFLNAQKDDDPQATTRSAHTIKGVAGNIAAREVQKTAEDLELACNNNSNSAEIEQLKDKVLTELSVVLSGLESLHSTTEENQAQEQTDEQLDQEKFQSLLVQLRGLLKDDDAESSSIIEQLEMLPGIKTYSNELKRLSVLIGDYEFEEALETLDGFQKNVS
jgi:polar amino acid transport system substrate-binding protein